MPTFTGTTGADEIIGSEGDDIIDGRNGADHIFARSGNDVIRGIVGAVEVYGGSGDDTIYVGPSPNFNDPPNIGIIDGGDGVDTLDFRDMSLYGFGGTVFTTDQSDPSIFRYAGLGALNGTSIRGIERLFGPDINMDYQLSAARTVQYIQGGSGADRFAVGGSPTIRAGVGNDVFSLVSSGSQLFGEDGDDFFDIGDGPYAGGTLIDGGDGVDSIRLITLQTAENATINFALGDGTYGGLTYRSIESLVGLVRSTTQSGPILNVIGTQVANFIDFSSSTTGIGGTISAGGGNDIVKATGRIDVYGGTGNDTLSTAGTGSLYGEAGDDVLSGSGNLFGGDGDDILTEMRMFGVTGRFDGGSGFDTLTFLDGAIGDRIVLSLRDGTMSRSDETRVYNATVSGIERVIGTSGADTITLADGAEQAQGGGGADILRGGAGNDILYGDGLTEASTDGADQLFGDEGDDFIVGGGGNDQMSGGAGSDVLIGGTGSNILDGGDGSDLAVFSFARSSATISYSGGDIRVEGLTGAIDTLRGIESLRFSDGVYDVVNGQVSAQGRGPIAGTAGNDRLTGTAAADILSGGAGNDILRGGAGSDFIDGGAGIDTARYGGTLQSYSTVTTAVVGGGEEGGIDQLTGIEVLRFLDGRLSFDASDATSVVYRLYDAAFDRAPDVFGLADYARAIQEGRATAQSILEVFFGSEEFRARYGALNNEQFVREMYRFSLNREGDAAGVTAYTNALIDGSTTRLQLLVIFSESQEHQAQINGVITSRGLFVQDEQTASVARLYDSVFNRLPDLGGLKAYRDALDDGYTLKDVAAVLVASPEFQTRFGALTNQQFVEQIYRFVLDREGDTAGVQAYVTALNNGASRTDVVLVLSESQEHRFSYQATFDNQIRQFGVNGYDPNGSGVGRAVEETFDKLHDALVLPDDGFVPVAHDDGILVAFDDFVAPNRAAAGDVQLHVLDAQDGLPDLGPNGTGTPDVAANHHHSDWM